MSTAVTDEPTDEPTDRSRPAGEPTDGLHSASEHPLDNPAWSALTGPHHRQFAQTNGQAARYQPEVSPWTAVAGPDGWADLAELAGGPGAEVSLMWPAGTELPAGWEVLTRLPGVQLVDTALAPAPDAEAVVLTAADVPEMLALVARTDPGPFRPRTIELGTYLGIRRGGELIAMAGERMRPPGWSEISAVCTDEAYRGQGLAARLVLAVAHLIRARGDVPFLHSAAQNTGAIRLYESLGFTLRRHVEFSRLRVPTR